MAKDPSFPFYAQDFLVDTLRWSRDMKSLHVDLMCEAWANKEIRDDNGFPEGLSEADKKIWVKIKHKWNLENGVWSSGKLEDVRIKRKKFIQHQSDNGKKGGRPKNPNKTQIKPNAKPKKKPLENEYEKEKEIEYELENETLVVQMAEVWKKERPDYAFDKNREYESLKQVADFMLKQAGLQGQFGNKKIQPEILTVWRSVAQHTRGHPHFEKYTIAQINKYLSGIIISSKNGSGKTNSKINGQQLNEAFAKFYSET